MKFKNLLSVLVLFAIALFAIPTQALDIKTVLSGTNTIAIDTGAGVASPVNPIVIFADDSSPWLQISYSLTGRGCLSNVVFGFQKSLDGSTWDTNLILITVLSQTNNHLTGLPRSVCATNIANAPPYMRLVYEANSASNICTNIVIKAGNRKR